MDLSALSLAELRNLQQIIPAEMKRREAQEKIDALNEVRALAKAKGFSLEDLLGKEAKVGKVRSGGVVKVKYRHPNDASLEWTGRGRRPKWVETWLAEGRSIDELAV